MRAQPWAAARLPDDDSSVTDPDREEIIARLAQVPPVGQAAPVPVPADPPTGLTAPAVEAYDRAPEALHAMRALAAADGANNQTVGLLQALEAHLGQPQTPSATAVPAGHSPRSPPSSPPAAGAEV